MEDSKLKVSKVSVYSRCGGEQIIFTSSFFLPSSRIFSNYVNESNSSAYFRAFFLSFPSQFCIYSILRWGNWVVSHLSRISRVKLRVCLRDSDEMKSRSRNEINVDISMIALMELMKVMICFHTILHMSKARLFEMQKFIVDYCRRLVVVFVQFNLIRKLCFIGVKIARCRV